MPNEKVFQNSLIDLALPRCVRDVVKHRTSRNLVESRVDLILPRRNPVRHSGQDARQPIIYCRLLSSRQYSEGSANSLREEAMAGFSIRPAVETKTSNPCQRRVSGIDEQCSQNGRRSDGRRGPG